MMVNVSRFTAVQSKVKLLISEYVDHLRTAIDNYSLLPERDAAQNSDISDLRSTWASEFADIAPD